MESCAYAEVKGASHAIWEEKPKQMKRIIDALLGDLD
jgi:pimeloyl-ACP methyl ester carboxylesterase